MLLFSEIRDDVFNRVYSFEEMKLKIIMEGLNGCEVVVFEKNISMFGKLCCVYEVSRVDENVYCDELVDYEMKKFVLYIYWEGFSILKFGINGEVVLKIVKIVNGEFFVKVSCFVIDKGKDIFLLIICCYCSDGSEKWVFLFIIGCDIGWKIGL